MVDFFCFDIILDDIVFPDGQTRMGVLGGGGPQAAFGMRLWVDSVGLVASIGPDLPAEVRKWLNESGININALRLSQYPTPRAWQVMETDGHRTEIWRISPQAVQDHMIHKIARIPPELRAARAFHICVSIVSTEYEFLSDLRATGAILSIELFETSERPLSTVELERLLTLGDIFSANLEEARSLLGNLEPLELLQRLLSAGAPLVVLRMGSKGSLAVTHDNSNAVYVPSVPVRVIDPVGAGNAFCGGFLAGWVQTHDLTRSAAMGAVSASFLVEQVGLPHLTNQTRLKAAERLTSAIKNIQVISISQGGFSI